MAAIAAAAAFWAAVATAMALATAVRSGCQRSIDRSTTPCGVALDPLDPLAAAFLPGLITFQSCSIRESAA